MGSAYVSAIVLTLKIQKAALKRLFEKRNIYEARVVAL
jgi:hypothetical protein